MAKRKKPTLIVRQNDEARDGKASRVTVTEAGRILITAMASEGQDPGTIAKALGIARSTLNNIRERDEEVDEAWAVGHAALADELTHLLLTHARGEGKAAVIALIYLTKARLGWTDQPKPQPEERAPSVVINLPDARSPEEHMKLLTYQPAEQLPEAVQKSDIFGLIPVPAKAVVR